jgi:hypothetical protein
MRRELASGRRQEPAGEDACGMGRDLHRTADFQVCRIADFQIGWAWRFVSALD